MTRFTDPLTKSGPNACDESPMLRGRRHAESLVFVALQLDVRVDVVTVLVEVQEAAHRR